MLDLYGDFVEGSPECMFLVVSEKPLSVEARNALCASAERLGFAEAARAWIVMKTVDLAGDAVSLSPQDVVNIVEGLDPVAVVAADLGAASAISAGRAATLDIDAINRVMGRTVVAFGSFEGMLANSDSKQRAWHLLKSLQR